jgi:hypothetical protein
VSLIKDTDFVKIAYCIITILVRQIL